MPTPSDRTPPDRSPTNRTPSDRTASTRFLSVSPAVRFAVIFLVCIGAFSIIMQLPAVNDRLVVPFTALIARASGAVLNLLGQATQVTGTNIQGPTGFTVNILNGCNGVYVMAILASAVLAFPSTGKEKLLGLALGIPGIQVVNIIRIVSLYLIGLNKPEMFDSFHLYIWQTGVILSSMAIWIFWAEVLVGRAGRAGRSGSGGPAGPAGHGGHGRQGRRQPASSR